jgi:threonine synthase
MDANVYNIAVDGTFDDAQAIVKTLFGDLNFKDKYSLGAVNSINWARVLAQVVYYFYAGLKVMKETGSDKISFSVPTGNFGDIFAGYVAYLMGLPIDKLILATNENDILSRFFNTGIYNVEGVHPTISPSMDIQVASNFERWLYLHANRNSEQLCAWMQQFKETKSLTIGNPDELDEIMIAGKADTAKTLATIKRFYEDSKYILDPHTAVGVSVALDKAPATPVICLATAHPAKFPDAIKDATGESNLATAPEIEALKGKPTRKFNLPADAGAVAAFVIEKLQ